MGAPTEEAGGERRAGTAPRAPYRTPTLEPLGKIRPKLLGSPPPPPDAPTPGTALLRRD